ncbi:MAG: hypothetical protein PF689_02290 [Deltaproteobacteria bacterium]|jgi:hypothetical protein|nr:hypothetical protein [Deltaproteobacteria bacterium]
MEVLNKKTFFLILVFILPAGFSCKKKEQISDSEMCSKLCKRIAECSKEAEKLQKKPGNKSRNHKKTSKMINFFKNEEQCNKSCALQIKEKTRKNKKNFFAFFLNNQMECFQYPSCKDFNSCRLKKHEESIFNYPMDELNASRCEKVCSRINKCAEVLVPRVYGNKYKEMSLQKQAEAVKRRANKRICLKSCRYNFIKHNFAEKKKKTIYLAPSEKFMDTFAKYLNCIGFEDCGAFVDCAVKQD